MDAPNPSALPTFASRTPLRIGSVGLVARDLDKLTNFYQGLLGLTIQERTDKVAKLGTGGTTLLEIEHRPNALPDDTATAGLYHTAFLMPTRADHARWIMHIANNRVPITGASDHGVSEALYLADPEGNGIEVYADRPAALWRTETGEILTVATTRAETMLGDTGVAVHPDDARYASLIGKHVELPLTGRRIPVIADDYVDRAFGTGVVKVTPAHDFNDYAVGQRHGLETINLFTEVAALNDNAPEPYRGLDRYAARKARVKIKR
mgnify:CR=1 FL=1